MAESRSPDFVVPRQFRLRSEENEQLLALNHARGDHTLIETVRWLIMTAGPAALNQAETPKHATQPAD